ncbi:unnamed protein product [Trichogramma brassicae]|uniref:Uncharacterized protein n=1 Tax=Trichogramma brassicae TaxID=86971 RepID=A0A6H5IVN6_9HYME|nr:unnamed protein product [Trichogramma brassicae]
MGYSTTGVAGQKNEVETNHVLFKNTMKNENPEHLSPLGPTIMDLQGLKKVVAGSVFIPGAQSMPPGTTMSSLHLDYFGESLRRVGIHTLSIEWATGVLYTQLKKIAWISTWIIHADSTWIIQGFLEDRTLIPRGSNMDQIQSPPHDRSTWNPCMTHVESLYDPRGLLILVDFHVDIHAIIFNWDGEEVKIEEKDEPVAKSLNHMHNIDDLYLGCPFVIFVARCGYRDKPEIDEQTGKPILRRTTALHRAGKQGIYDCVRELFKIYNRFNANYTDEDGFTHFHAACLAGCDDVVGQFLKLGQDPDCLAQKFAYPPLHLAVSRGREEVTRLLLDSGADQNLANADGFTPLHMLGLSEFPSIEKSFFKINDEKNQTVQLDARDRKGRTPLEWAVANIRPHVVEALLDRGADLSSFVFPTEAYFGSRFRRDDNVLGTRESRLATNVLLIVEILKKRGYELSRSDALTIMKFFAHIGKPRKIVYEDGDEEYCAMCETDDKATAGPFCSAHGSTILARIFSGAGRAKSMGSATADDAVLASRAVVVVTALPLGGRLADLAENDKHGHQGDVEERHESHVDSWLGFFLLGIWRTAELLLVPLYALAERRAQLLYRFG